MGRISISYLGVLPFYFYIVRGHLTSHRDCISFSWGGAHLGDGAGATTILSAVITIATPTVMGNTVQYVMCPDFAAILSYRSLPIPGTGEPHAGTVYWGVHRGRSSPIGLVHLFATHRSDLLPLRYHGLRGALVGIGWVSQG